MAKSSTLSKVGKWILDILIITLGTGIFALGVNSFTAPNNIAPGGVTGISTVLSYITDINIGQWYSLINIPLTVVGFIFLNKKTMFKTLYSVIVFTVLLDFVFPFVPVYTGEGVIAGVFGGVLTGAGLGIVYTRESTTGGTDIVNRIINRYIPHFKIGQITFFTDAIIIIFAGVAFQNINSAFYAIIAIFVQGRIIDKLVYGGYEGKMMMIFSDHAEEISKKILSTKRGVTMVKGVGGFTNSEKHIIYTVVHKNQYFKIRNHVKEIDPNAFVVILSASEVLGQGFAKLENQ